MSLWENLGHLIYLKKRGVLLFLITAVDSKVQHFLEHHLVQNLINDSPLPAGWTRIQKMGTAGADPPADPPHPYQGAASSPVLLPPSPAAPMLGLCLQSAAQHSHLEEGEVSVGVPAVGGPPR
ncbi:hypothetical protein INR49_020275 [Caranx melampygus]|nr:hypothetical protein INR49_020275 [Caranx melampygus]